MNNLIEIENIRKYYSVNRGFFSKKEMTLRQLMVFHFQSGRVRHLALQVNPDVVNPH